MIPALQIVATFVMAIAGAGVGSYVGIRVALAEIRGRLDVHDERFTTHKDRYLDHEKRLRDVERWQFNQK